jgi:hypothetical protein
MVVRLPSALAAVMRLSRLAADAPADAPAEAPADAPPDAPADAPADPLAEACDEDADAPVDAAVVAAADAAVEAAAEGAAEPPDDEQAAKTNVATTPRPATRVTVRWVDKLRSSNFATRNHRRRAGTQASGDLPSPDGTSPGSPDAVWRHK